MHICKECTAFSTVRLKANRIDWGKFEIVSSKETISLILCTPWGMWPAINEAIFRNKPINATQLRFNIKDNVDHYKLNLHLRILLLGEITLVR